MKVYLYFHRNINRRLKMQKKEVKIKKSSCQCFKRIFICYYSDCVLITCTPYRLLIQKWIKRYENFSMCKLCTLLPWYRKTLYQGKKIYVYWFFWKKKKEARTKIGRYNLFISVLIKKKGLWHLNFDLLKPCNIVSSV